MMSPPLICTILAKNYIASARVLAKSFLDQHPDGKCYALLIDDFEGYIDPRNEILEIVPLSALNIPNQKDFCFKYTILELATAVKPYFLEYLFNVTPIGELLYLDPDIMVLDSLDNLLELFKSYDILLTPHITKDYPDDNLKPNDMNHLRCGIFNLGFIGLKRNEKTLSFLKWWQTKLYERCIVSPLDGLFVDQKFIDLAIVLFENIGVIKDEGYNVAWWNIHYRRVTNDGDKWACNGKPLYFYHFSHYRPEKPEVMSPVQTRYTLSDNQDLMSLFHKYRCLLLENGYEESKKWPYTYGYFRNGMEISKEVRKFYRKKRNRRTQLKDPFNSKYLMAYLLYHETKKNAMHKIKYYSRRLVAMAKQPHSKRSREMTSN